MNKWTLTAGSSFLFWSVIFFPIVILAAVVLAPFYLIGVIKK